MDKSLKKQTITLVMLFLYLGTFLYAQKVIQLSHAIVFVGQKYMDKGQLSEALGVKNKSFYQFWKEDDPRIDDKLLPTLEASLRSFYRSEGFYDAHFTIEKNTTMVRVGIKEDEPIRIVDVDISSDYNLSSLLLWEKGDIFRASDFIKTKSQIIVSLLKEGYCSYDLDTKAYVDLDTHEVALVYQLTKGGDLYFW
ncbi:MAG: hypothetical protein Q9M36_11650 [Sulfurovum sp.]|nr:hypothetical protein [Sulfurovum sp.]